MLAIPQEFARGRGSISSAEMLRLIDDATARVLFFEMGQNHAGLRVSPIEQWLRSNSSFKKIYRLGATRHEVSPLFACLR